MTCPICGQNTPPLKYLQWEDIAWVKCARCGGGWREDYRSEMEEAAPGVTETYTGYIGKAEMFRAVAMEKARWIAGELETGMPVIEVGPGIGLVSSCLLEISPDTRYVAIEPNPIFQEALKGVAQTIHHGEYSEAMSHALEDVGAAGAPVLIYLDNVLEHMVNPLEAVKLAAKLAPAGSKLLIEVPNEFGLKHRYKLQDFLRQEQKPPTFLGHINLFTPGSMRAMFEAAGLQYSIKYHPIRSDAQVTYCMQRYPIPTLAHIAVSILRLLPIDYMIGCPFWLRAKAVVGSRIQP
jgi:hypothetical protein